MARILIADQVSERRSILCTFLRGDEHLIIPVTNEDEASRFMREVHPELIIAEGTVSGVKLLTDARDFDSDIAVIIILAGPPSVDQVVELMNQGVSDILVSPLDINDVQTKVERALNRHPGADALQIRFRDLVGSSSRMQAAFQRIVKAGASENPVLIVGEQGTGKRLVAEQIHALSGRKDGPFRLVNCAGFTSPELESELFGHEAGASASATQRRRGQLELADGGTVCLQEIGALTPTVQTKLLRFMEEQVIERAGTEKFLTADVRVLAASSEPLLYRIQEGHFRSDLYYTVSTCIIELPPLRARINDIPELVELFLGRYDVQAAGEAMELLMNYPWPGNVDELKNAVEQAVNICENNRIELRDLPPRVLRAVARTGRKYKFMPRAKEPNGP
jgi:DNA-binding NtrC family response regulator